MPPIVTIFNRTARHQKVFTAMQSGPYWWMAAKVHRLLWIGHVDVPLARFRKITLFFSQRRRIGNDDLAVESIIDWLRTAVLRLRSSFTPVRLCEIHVTRLTSLLW